ncbi:hypothetical protein BC826DRAFT_976823, partial [Russula brevipes]
RRHAVKNEDVCAEPPKKKPRTTSKDVEDTRPSQSEGQPESLGPGHSTNALKPRAITLKDPLANIFDNPSSTAFPVLEVVPQTIPPAHMVDNIDSSETSATGDSSVPAVEATPAPQDEQTPKAVSQSDSTGTPLPVVLIPTQQSPAAAPASKPDDLDLPDRITPMLAPVDSALGTNEAIHQDAPTTGPDLSIRLPHSDPLAQPHASPSLGPMPVPGSAPPTALEADTQPPSAIAHAPPTALEADPQPPSAIARAPQGKTQKKYLRPGKMQPGDSVTARNLCAIDWCASNPSGSIGEFSKYWDTTDSKTKALYRAKEKKECALAA